VKTDIDTSLRCGACANDAQHIAAETRGLRTLRESIIIIIENNCVRLSSVIKLH